MIYYVVKEKLFRLPRKAARDEILSIRERAGMVGPCPSPDGTAIAFLYQEGDPMPLNKLRSPRWKAAPFSHSTVPIGYAGSAGRRRKGAPVLLTRNGATKPLGAAAARGEPRQLQLFSGRIFDFAWARDGNNWLLTKGDQLATLFSSEIPGE